jgi:hypothetical protein
MKANEIKSNSMWIPIFVAAMVSTLFAIPLLTSAALPQDSVPPTAKLLACWKFEDKHTTAGKCPTTVQDSWFLCLSETLAGGIHGTLTINHMEMLESAKLSPNDFGDCLNNVSPSTVNLLNYDVTVEKSPKGDTLILSETNHKCAVGDCNKMIAKVLKGSLSLKTDTQLIFAPVDGSKITLEKFEDKKDEKNNK